MSGNVHAAVLERLTSSLPGDIRIYDGTVVGAQAGRYVVTYVSGGARSSSAVDGASRDCSFSVQVMSVIIEPLIYSDCVFLSSAVQDALTDWRPTVDGLSVGQFVHQSHRWPTPDESVADRHVMFAVDQFSLLADHL